jgi:glycosyltransferase involved in cell wall biosynthesis
MVGHGKLLKKCKKLAEKLNIYFMDFADDKMKDTCFRTSRIIVHPSTFDSGGMSCAEGMAYGLPAVGFDLETHKTYYPKGMLKAKTKEDFANYIRE